MQPLPEVAWVVATSIIDPKISHQSKEAVIDSLFFYVIFLVLGALVNLYTHESYCQE